MKHTVIGLDIAKTFFQLHTVDPSTGRIECVKLRRGQVLEHFAKRAPALVAMEACGGAHWWARQLNGLGHEVRLLPAQAVRPFVLRNKTDAADARAIWTAVQQPGLHTVAPKTETQQSVLALHRMRAQLLKFRTMQSNAMRGFLLEFGQPIPAGYRALCQQLPAALAALDGKVPAMLLDSLREQWARVQQMDREIALLERRLEAVLRDSPACQAIAQIPGVGLLTATAAVAAIGDAHAFRSARQFAAWLGMVPRQRGTGGQVRQLGLSKQGDKYLRTLLMHGARALIARAKRSAWVEALLARRAYNVVVGAVANKLARTIWAVLARGKPYRAATVGAVVG